MTYILHQAVICQITSLLKYGFNPAVDTNPADGVGTMYLNTTDGNMFICIDATTDQNEWNNVGVGTGDVVYIPWTFGGTVSGYMAGGYPYTSTDIESISFTSDGNSVVVSGSLTSSPNGSYAHANASSTTHGYLAGGFGPGNLDKVDKYNFSTNNNKFLNGAILRFSMLFLKKKKRPFYVYHPLFLFSWLQHVVHMSAPENAIF